jgi:hypothetical protein
MQCFAKFIGQQDATTLVGSETSIIAPRIGEISVKVLEGEM